MTVRRRVLACLACLSVAWLAADDGRGQDQVVLLDGDRFRGSIVSVSPDAVEIEDRNQKVSRHVITDVREVAFDGEPSSLADARGLLLKRDARGALEELAKVEAAEINAAEPRIREEYEFVKLAASARVSSAADGPAVAGALKTFLAAKTRSHHFYAGQELLGDMLAKLGKFDEAAAAYAELDRGPPSLRVRAATAKARLLLLQRKPKEAMKQFEAATRIATDAADAASGVEKGKAELGIARCLALSGRPADGVAAAKAAIRKATPADRDLLAAAFVTLGGCQRATGDRNDDAIVSFLTVDLVYNGVPELHAEALYNLVELWESTKQPERAREARQALITTYPQSSWTRKLGGGKAS